MSAIQRKLVHKQFNSPMGLYSQENVNATLNRELKAFGAEGVEIDESLTKPLNLANSAVLRAVEEEDQKTCEDQWQRPSRARHRQLLGKYPPPQLHQQQLEQIKTQYFSHQQDVTIDRDTVLKINRLATRKYLHSRDHSWPPTTAAVESVECTTSNKGTEASICSSPHENVIHFKEVIYKQHGIDKIRDKFNSPPRRATKPSAVQPRCKTPLISAGEAAQTADDAEIENTPSARGFSAPETKAADVDIGIVAPKREYYEQLAESQRWSKRQSQSLNRLQSRNRAVDLPPPKPRSSSVMTRASASNRPKMQRPLIKPASHMMKKTSSLATPMKQTHLENQPTALVDSRSTKQFANELAVQEEFYDYLPLPPTPPTNQHGATASKESSQKHKKLTDKPCEQVHKKATELADNDETPKRQQQLLSSKPKRSDHNPTQSIPVTLELANESKQTVHGSQATNDRGKDTNFDSVVQRIYDDACIYLRSIDLEDQTVAYIPAAITIMPSPPDEVIEDTTPIRYESETKFISNPVESSSKTEGSPIVQTYLTTAHDIKLQRQPSVVRKTDAAPEKQSNPVQRAKGPDRKNTNNLSQIEQKYANLQQSIAEHLKQIDAYMEHAKRALKQGIEEQEKALVPEPLPQQSWQATSLCAPGESPLQTILRKIANVARNEKLQQSKSISDDEISHQSSNQKPTENMPVVEQALSDLKDCTDTLASESKVLSSATKPPKSEPHLKLCIDQAQHGAASQCATCGNLDSKAPQSWGKMTPQDQWRMENMHNDRFDTYIATYEIRSPYISRQISWEDMFQNETVAKQTPKLENPISTAPKDETMSHKNTLEILHEQKQDAPPVSEVPQSNKMENILPSDANKKVASQIPPKAVSTTPKPTEKPTENETYEYVPQHEGHNVGLLVHSPVQQQQQQQQQQRGQKGISDSTSSEKENRPPSRLQPIVDYVRCSSQPPPFEFLMQHGDTTAKTTAADHSQLHGSIPDFVPISDALPDHFTSSIDRPINRSFDNVSPRPYIAIEGYKRVAWPPASEERIIREFTPQPHSQSPAPGYGYAPAHQQGYGQVPSAAPAQGPIYNNISNNPPSGNQTSLYQNSQQQPNYQSAAPNYQAQAQPQAHVHHQTQSQPQPKLQPQQYNQHQNYQSAREQEQTPERPIQYTQAQFNRTPSYEPAYQTPTPQQPPQQQTYQQAPANQSANQAPVQAYHASSTGWKPIQAPTPKPESQYHGNAGQHQQQQQQPHYYPQQQQQQQPSPHYQPPTPQQQNYQPGPQYQPQQNYQAPSSQYHPDHYQQQQPHAHPQAHVQQQQPNYQQQPQQPQQPYYQQQQQPQQQQQYQPQWNQQQQQQYQPAYNAQPSPQYNPPPSAPQSNYSPSQQQQPPLQYGQQPTQNNFYPQNPQQQPQQHQQPISQDQIDRSQQQLPQDYRGGSPGIITLRKEAPVTQKPSPVYTSQPAAVSYQGGSKLRGDLKWPPPEYKEAAARENEERRQLALGPVCRPRRVNRDYTPFFAKHALNSTYPSYKVPPGTQHMLA